MSKFNNIVSSCNIKYTLLILIFYFISFTESFITTNRYGINVNHVFSPSSKCILSRKQNQHQCFLFNNTDVSNNTGVTFGTECLNNLLNTTNTVPNIQPIIDDDIPKDMITPEIDLAFTLIPKTYRTFHNFLLKKFMYVYAIISADEMHAPTFIKTEIEKMRSYGINNIWTYKVLDYTMSRIRQDEVSIIQSPGIAVSYNYKISNKMKKKLSEKNIKLIEGEKIDDILKMAIDELNRIAGHNDYPTLYGKGKVLKLLERFNGRILAGCVVTYGKINPYLNIRVIRGDCTLFCGKISLLTTGIENPLEIFKGEICWITLEDFDDIEVGDVIEAYSD